MPLAATAFNYGRMGLLARRRGSTLDRFRAPPRYHQNNSQGTIVMSRKYTAEFASVAVSAAQDFFEIIATASQIIRVTSAFIGQSSDAGDAEAEMLPIQIRRASGSYTTGSGGSTPTAAPHDFISTAFGGTIRANSTTAAVVGTGVLTTISAETFNVQAGWYYTPTENEFIELNPGQALIFHMTATPADALTMSGRVTFEVIGAA